MSGHTALKLYPLLRTRDPALLKEHTRSMNVRMT